MHKYDFDCPIDRTGTFSIKWDNAKDLLPLWVADMDLQVAEPILAALRERINHPIFGYSTAENETLRQAIIGWYDRRFGLEISPEELLFSPGVVPTLCVLIQMLTQEGDGIVIQPPVYHPFAGKIRENGRRVVENPLLYKDGIYQIDFEDLKAKLSMPNVSGLLLCSPHNPVGRVWSPNELKKIVEICRTTDKWIISDEIHCDILRTGVTHHPLLKLCPSDRDRIILCGAPTKTFNLAGVQFSSVIIPNLAYREAWKTLVSRMGMLDASPFAIVAATAAYAKGEEWLEQVNSYIEENLRFAVTYLKENLPRAKAYVPEGTYLLWVNFREYFPNGADLETCMRKKAKVMLNEGYTFGTQGEGFERINAACAQSILAQALAKIKEAILS